MLVTILIGVAAFMFAVSSALKVMAKSKQSESLRKVADIMVGVSFWVIVCGFAADFFW